MTTLRRQQGERGGEGPPAFFKLCLSQTLLPPCGSDNVAVLRHVLKTLTNLSAKDDVRDKMAEGVHTWVEVFF